MNNIQLFKACRRGDIASVRQYVTPENINLWRGTGSTPLHWAIMGKHMDIVQMLIDLGADIHLRSCQNTALIYAVDAGADDIVRLLLRLGVNVNASSSAKITPPMIAAENGNGCLRSTYSATERTCAPTAVMLVAHLGESINQTKH